MIITIHNMHIKIYIYYTYSQLYIDKKKLKYIYCTLLIITSQQSITAEEHAADEIKTFL